MRKLLLVINNIDFLYSHRWPIIEAALREDFDVHVACNFSSDSALRKKDLVTYHFIPFNRSSTNPLKDFPALYQLFKLYRKIKPDVIHQVGLKPILYGSLVARFFTRCRYINAISGLGYLFINNSLRTKLIRKILYVGLRLGCHSQRCHFIFQNNDDIAIFKHVGLVNKKNDITLIKGSGVDLTVFKPTQPASDVPIIVFPARFLWDKGLQEFIDAVSKIRHEVSARFVLVGRIDSDNPASATQEDITRWQEEGLIECWGWRKDMDEVFRLASIVCLPSYREGMPKALLEAAASGCAIITTDAPGCRDVILDDESGFLVPVADSDCLASRLHQLIDDSTLRQQFSMLARRRAEALFDVDKIVEQHMLLYKAS